MVDIKLIGLSRAIGAGKSTVAQHLCSSYGFTELTFKNSMVHCLAHIFEVDGQIFHDRELKEKPDAALFGRSPREVMQSFGTDWGRKLIHPDIWVHRVENKIVHFNRCLLSDVRFGNEALMIKRRGGVIWHIERKNNPFAVNTGYESEHGIDDRYIDQIICNDGDMDHLRAEVAGSMAGLVGRG
ncbi:MULTISPECIES: deoxynucleotide monophosphate kinase family protein [Nitrosomonas]|uniref:Deoxynucleotide monophosphate kinase n=1 Tax=Nitrosomonas communis TaxID=44574 RepID=A0A5D3Y740_9PROT|nr:MULTISPECIES: hypothetical protein [Nitrosomonas]TYP74177.1 hypothetical protein BCL69_10907 [Nitrosomonas communis]UVS62565.1 hypothetical protein NX761_05440 [Nitrosomonas sp. PLL12]